MAVRVLAAPLLEDLVTHRLLVVEDERSLAEMLVRLLREEGYQADAVHDGQAGLHRALVGRYDGLVLDRGLPAIEGVDLLRRLRRSGVTAPVLMLTAYDAVADRVEGLDAGAQDYLGKPFDVDELLARVRAMLRRTEAPEDGDVVELGTRRLEVASRLVLGGPEPVGLSEREATLLQTLARRPSRVFTREELRDRIFAEAETEAVVETYVSYLRRKLGAQAVLTVRGVGYRMGSA
jgi:two-component system, OmpR family, response regulator QseB